MDGWMNGQLTKRCYSQQQTKSCFFFVSCALESTHNVILESVL